MSERLDLLLTNIGQLVTCVSDGKALRGQAMQQIGLSEDDCVGVQDGKIVAVGKTAVLTQAHAATKAIDCTSRAVIPGFVDCHTHLVFGGNRVAEYELRVKGASYMEIMAAGGGIRSSVVQTRAAGEAALLAAAKARLDEMCRLGTTTVEIKTGYGLDVETELKMLRVIEALDAEHPCTIVPTFLGAHTVPPEFEHDVEGYVSLVVEEMIPETAVWYADSTFKQKGIPLFIDVFCEDHAFDVEQSRRILEAGVAAGMQVKIHVDQFNAFGGLEMALELGAVSVDHLEVTTEAGIAALAESNPIGVPLPAANFNLGQTSFAPARRLIDAGAALALATDLNPGSAPCYGMPTVMTLATRYLRLLPSEALVASTINGAHAVGLAAQVGSIEVGKTADLLILKTADYRDLTYFFGHNPIEKVIVGGREMEHE